MKEIVILSGNNLSFKHGQKMDIFKGHFQWILSKNQTFSYLRFSQKFYQKTTFLILRKEKNDFNWKKFQF